jgi:RND superfamily putative drug exporter
VGLARGPQAASLGAGRSRDDADPRPPGIGHADLTTRKAFDQISREFGPGANTSVMVVADRRVLGDRAVSRLRDDLATRDDLVSVSAPVDSPDGALAVLHLQPEMAAVSDATPSMVADIRADLPKGALLTGDVPLFADISAMLAERLPRVIAFVVGVSVLLLAAVFRSVLVPLKAAVMNLLSIGAAYGVLTAVFQWGWGVHLFGMDRAVPVSSWVPILIFAILFGLSMDYEVFLLSRIREHWLATGDARGSVIEGLAGTGRVITSAAAIMVAVFLGFATEVDVVVKMLGLGMAVAVFLDATLVRMVLVPATMAMLGRLNWWIPAWLDRLLPAIAVDAAYDDPEPAPAREPDPESRRLVDA